jgi:hypothetical protein
MHHRFFSSKANTLLLLALMTLVVILTRTMLLNDSLFTSFDQTASSEEATHTDEEDMAVQTIKLY